MKQTREEVLQRILEGFIIPRFNQNGHEITDKIKVSVGIPKGGKDAIGECWQAEAGNGFYHIFVSPIINDIIRVTDILIHEVIHTWIRGHRKDFAKVGKSVGLQKPWTATTATEELTEDIKCYITANSIEYPHVVLDTNLSAKKKQSTRMIKLECEECGYIVRTSKTNIQIGVPTCCCGTQFTYEDEEI